MKIIKIPKRNGKFRTIYVPTEAEKAECREAVDKIKAIRDEGPSTEVSHGFEDGRSPVTNALQHIGFKYSLCFDLKDFFDSVTHEMVEKALVEDKTINDVDLMFIKGTITGLFPDGAAHQGPPSSPYLANIAAIPMDKDILKLQRTNGRFKNFIYTRYADDLTFSFDSPGMIEHLMKEIPKIVERHGFKINESKTHLQCAKAGRRVITGIAVDDKLHTPRSVKRRLRAAKHQIENGIHPRNLRRLISRQKVFNQKGKHISLNRLLVAGAKGLAEWARLRLPKNWNPNDSSKVQSHIINIPDSSVAAADIVFGYKRKFD